MQEVEHPISAQEFAIASALGTLGSGASYAIDPTTLGPHSDLQAFVEWLASDAFDESALALRQGRADKGKRDEIAFADAQEFVRSLGERATGWDDEDAASLAVLNENGLGLHLPRPTSGGALDDLSKADRRRLLQKKRRAAKRIHSRARSMARFSAEASKRLVEGPKARKSSRSR